MPEQKLRTATPEDFARASQKKDIVAKVPVDAPPADAPVIPADAKDVFSIEPPSKDLQEPSAQTPPPDVPPANEGEQKDQPKTDEKKPGRRRIKDLNKPFFETKAPATEVKNDAPALPENIQKELDEARKKIADYEQRLSKSTYKIIDEAEKAGKTIFDVFEEFRSEDVSKLSDTQLYERELIKSGVKPAGELDADSTDTSLEEEMEKFRAMPKIAQNREIAQIRKQYEGDKDARQNDLLSKLSAENQKREQARQAEMAEQEKISLRAVDEYNALCDSYVGKEHYSVMGTPQMAESLKNILQDPINGLIGRNQDGSLNANRLFDLAHYVLFGDLREQNLENKIYAQGFEDLEKTVVAKGGEQKIVRSPKASTTNAPTELRAVSVGHPSVHV